MNNLENRNLTVDCSHPLMLSTKPYSTKIALLNTVPFVFNIPHAGRNYAQDFLAQTDLDLLQLRASEDCYVDLLFNNVTQYGANFIAADFPRAYVDVNRRAFALDTKLLRNIDKQFYEKLHAIQNKPSIRSGYGVIPRNVALGKGIYKRKIEFLEAIDRLNNFYFPYHAKLIEQLVSLHSKFGEAILIDCHSMPSVANHYQNQREPDIILGDKFGRSCHPLLIDLSQSILEELGYFVVRNHPYAGGFITEHYGRPDIDFHALQIEINRGLYINPYNLQPNNYFKKLQKDMGIFSKRLIDLWQQQFYQSAAE